MNKEQALDALTKLEAGPSKPENSATMPKDNEKLEPRADRVDSVMCRCRMDFENWLMSEGVSIERYECFPHSYVVPDVGTKWVAWQAAHRQYA